MDKKSDMFLFSGIPWLYSSEKWGGGGGEIPLNSCSGFNIFIDNFISSFIEKP